VKPKGKQKHEKRNEKAPKCIYTNDIQKSAQVAGSKNLPYISRCKLDGSLGHDLAEPPLLFDDAPCLVLSCKSFACVLYALNVQPIIGLLMLFE
jgi:hypothetical protein